ncbi:1-deoxy-D-xylulose-5-phosphate synthase [Coprobacter fastidiosus]|uniref:1-deoxy-D-xylulose-5-phosphate synthase n=1 Tax=Coprobacter fastidiosus NSB1 = JCM 33896 TaxID=1349822 RepID=A0A495WJW1_9BACT|nr:1-deoxy-D-xylulose-5-phosphate synthase [Coprobacter fastidiosus]ERM88300.1 1-deoxy-D-xylulose-5-phosphate synthase [Coprobacter fastidiosus NSB1 = JCM 33896]RKT61394.1 1-deoxy-D-xylulose-5-phosphate synthase [Coprobacter fastidiosus NSB1 = JCM 33896]BEG61465.1 1-deoxy-D-xylulose-5-phosphate synthase [Coprobacter fastidiosus]HJF43121.1 1-deoxy-D-xylulose-5-phosphate synthase [Coprobacter fastidiosus]
MAIIKEQLLSTIYNPDDLRKLSPEQLPQICTELRQFLIDELSCNPGHFASSLGTVELTVALHYVFKTPYDRIVWDVGHQAYSHKILTERRDKFFTNRKFKGLSGFPSPFESKYDTFTAGHASNSISAALGMSVAANLKGENDRKVIAVIGDAAISGGLAFEGLNNASINPNNLLIILNDNDMAIDHNVGALNQYLVNITTSPSYNKLRYDIYRTLVRLKLISAEHRGAILRFNNSIKALISKHQNIFEGLNIRYFGPIDGHDVNYIIRVLNDIKEMSGPKLLHLKTIKGKGYAPAEKAATVWHAPGKFNKITGERFIVKDNNLPPLFQEVFGRTLVELARENKKIVGITPAMPTGCSMTYMMSEFPDRTFDVGIAEEHAVTFSGGLAKEGLIPFCNIYSTFMQRAFDEIIHDVAIQNLHVVFCLDRAGLVGEDGVTHHGAFDLSYLRCIPNMTIASPMNEHYLRHLMYTAQAKETGVFAIRYPRGRGSLVNWHCTPMILEIGKGRKLSDGEDIALISIGPIGVSAQKAIIRARQQGVSVAHYDMIFLKPIDEELLHEIGKKYSRIVTVEDGSIKGGLGMAVIEFMADNGYVPRIKRIGIPDQFIEHGTIPELYKLCGMDEDNIVSLLTSVW